MISRSGNRSRLDKTVASALLALSLVSIASSSGWAQAAQPRLGLQEQGAPPGSAPQSAPEQPVAPASADNPGLIDQMGKLFEKSLSILPPLKGPGETIDDLNARAKDAAKDAGDALSRLAKPSSMVLGRVICPAAVNGSPDCKAGADKLCQSKGYKEGKSLNTDSAQTCSAKVLIPGRTRKPDDCRTDNYVTSALCQ